MAILKLWNQHPLYLRQLCFHLDLFLLFFFLFFQFPITCKFLIERTVMSLLHQSAAKCCLSSASHRLQWGCMFIPSSQSRVHSHIALTTCRHVRVCLLLPYKKTKRARSTSVSTSFLLSFQKGFHLQSWHVFHSLSGFKLCCSCSRGRPQLKYVYCRAASLENVLSAVFSCWAWEDHDIAGIPPE